ncbi:MAG: hypothetical protein IT363_08630 [Methanoregulaceae archaeon]|nr:hypothetical protein [Methanoregulaceae archaeon]
MMRSALMFAMTALLAVSATAQQSSAQRIVPIRAAVAILDSDQTAGFPSNRTPHVWFNLENNRNVKPTGLTFSNVARASEWTGPAVARWLAQGFTPPAAGTSVTKRDSIYWEIRPSQASEDQFASTDIILLPVYGFVSLNSVERERLRQFMEKGGVLWVDVSGTATLDPVNGLPLPFLMQTVPGPNTFAVDYTQPLINYPIGLAESDIVQLQSENTVGMQYMNLGTAGYGALEGILQTLQPDSRRLLPVASDALGATISVGRVGDGYMVLTTRGVARTLNRIPSGTGVLANDGPRAITAAYDRTSDAAAKLVINMVHLVSGFSQGAKGSRGARSSPIDIGAPQLQKFADNTTSLTPIGANSYQAPVVYKGVVVVTSQDQVLVYDTNPRQDLDNDGDPDDGVRDYGLGTSWDLLWSSAPLSGPISAAVATEAPNAVNPNLRDQVIVIDANGTLHGFALFAYDANGVIQGGTAVAADYTVVPSSGAASFDFSADGPGPFAPVVHDGFVYVVDSQDSGLSRVGRSYVVDPAAGQQVRTGATGWSIGGVGAGAVMPDPSGPPTIGYIPIADNSGGHDRVMYVPSRANTLGPTNTAGLASIWLGAKGERPASASEGGGLLTVQTRAAGQGLDVYIPGAAEPKSLGVRLTILHPNGDPYTAAEMDAAFTGFVTQVNGILTFQMKGGASLVPGYGVRVDYTIDWGTGSPALTSQVIRGQLNLPDNANRARRVLHSIGITPKGTIHLVFSSQQSSVAPGSVPGGSYFAIREEGRGNFKILTRYDLYEPHQINLNQASTVTYPETLVNSDPLVRAPSPVAPFLGGRMQRLTYVGGPSIANDTVYVTAKGIRPLGFFSIPYLIVMAFPAEPETPEIRVGDISGGFTILQPDVSRSAFTVGTWTPDTFTILQPGQFVYDRDPGGNAGTIRIQNLSATTRGPVVNCLNTSQPIIIRRNGQPDLLIEPNALASRWSRLQWYTVFSGVDGNSPPFVSGNTLFAAGASSWPTILAGAGFTPSGQVFGMDASVSPNDPFLNAPAADSSRPWLRQFYQLFFDTPTDVRPNPAFRWPQLTGTSTFSDYAIRLQQSVLQQNGGGFASAARGVIGGDGGLFAWANEGLWSFRKADFVVADEGRVTRVDSVGNPIWSVKSTFQTGRQGDVGAAAATRPLVRPTRAYPLGDRQLLVVDTGANRVMRIDVSGREMRSLAGFLLDPNFRPAGLETGASLNLNGPRDAITFNRVVRAANNPLTDAQPFEYWTHYLVADAGNRRLVEIVDRYAYDPTTRQVGNAVAYVSNGQPALGVLFWHSPAAYSGGKFVYSSISRVFVEAGANSRWVYAAGIGESMPARADIGLDAPSGANERREDGNGGIVVFDGSNSVVVTEVTVPAYAANVFYNPATGNFNSPASGARRKRLGNLNSVTMRNIQAGGGTQLAIMFTDGEGVFEVVGSGVAWDVRWMMPRSVYTAMRRDGADNVVFSENPVDFRPTYAKRLDSGEVLICNGYSGWYQRSNVANPRVPFTGEVIMVDGDIDPTNAAPFGFGFGKINFGFKTLSVRVLLDNKPGADRESRGIVLPLFADRQ